MKMRECPLCDFEVMEEETRDGIPYYVCMGCLWSWQPVAPSYVSTIDEGEDDA